MLTPIVAPLTTALNTDVPVLSENTRAIVEIHSEEFGFVAMVCIGTTLVGSITLLGKPDSVVCPNL